MKWALTGLLGILIFLTAIFSNNHLNRTNATALELDKKDVRYGMIGDDALLPCAWDVDFPDRVMTENESKSIVLKVKNEFDVDCQSVFTLLAPSFNLSPHKDEQTLTVPPGKEGSAAWILTSQKNGTYEIVVSDGLTTRTFGLKVTNMFGLSANQAKAISGLGTIFGPMFTVPWWFDKWQQRRKETKKPSVNPPLTP